MAGLKSFFMPNHEIMFADTTHFPRKGGFLFRRDGRVEYRHVTRQPQIIKSFSTMSTATIEQTEGAKTNEKVSPKRPRSDSFEALPIIPVSPNRLVRDWDCPDHQCSGNIEVFRAPNSFCDKPAYARCSTSQMYEGRRCKLPMMFAKKASSCIGCRNTIALVSK